MVEGGEQHPVRQPETAHHLHGFLLNILVIIHPGLDLNVGDQIPFLHPLAIFLKAGNGLKSVRSALNCAGVKPAQLLKGVVNKDVYKRQPVGLWFKYGVVDDFMREWLVRKNELKAGEITREEYLEWKLNWPETCDDCGKNEPKKKWK